MNLDEAQRKAVADWIAQGLKLSDIQNRLASELGLRLTYIEVRLLVDDLKLTPKDPEPVKPSESVLSASAGMPATGARSPAARPGAPTPKPAPPAGAPGKVALSVDQLTRPGAVVSGKVTFSDGQQADWYLDQTGRLGVVTKQQGYKPSAADVQQFQAALQSEIARMGF